MLASVALSATFIVVQPRLLAGRDPAAVTAVQFAAGALVALPHALVFEGLPPAPATAGPVVALVALAFAGTLLPFWLFAYGQAHVPAGLAGAFLNLEPLVGVAVGWVGFGEAVTATAAARRRRRARGHRAQHLQPRRGEAAPAQRAPARLAAPPADRHVASRGCRRPRSPAPGSSPSCARSGCARARR